MLNSASTPTPAPTTCGHNLWISVTFHALPATIVPTQTPSFHAAISVCIVKRDFHQHYPLTYQQAHTALAGHQTSAPAGSHVPLDIIVRQASSVNVVASTFGVPSSPKTSRSQLHLGTIQHPPHPLNLHARVKPSVPLDHIALATGMPHFAPPAPTLQKKEAHPVHYALLVATVHPPAKPTHPALEHVNLAPNALSAPLLPTNSAPRVPCPIKSRGHASPVPLASFHSTPNPTLSAQTVPTPAHNAMVKPISVPPLNSG